MRLRTSTSARQVRTFRPEVLRLEDRIVPGEVLGTTLFWAMGSFAYPALLSQDSSGMDTAAPAPGAGTAGYADWSDDDASSWSVCQVGDSTSDALDATLADPPIAQTQPPATDTTDQVFATMDTDSDLTDTMDLLSQTPLEGGGMNYSTLPQQASTAQAAAGSSAGVTTPAINVPGTPPALPGGDSGHGGSAAATFGSSIGGVVSAQPAHEASHASVSSSPSIVATQPVATTSVQTAAPTTTTDAGSGTVTATAPADQASANTADANAGDTGGTAFPLLLAHPTAAPGKIHPQGANGAPPFSPQQIQQAYGLNNVSNQGSGQTIYIVDAYNQPNLSRDLQTFDAQWGLPNPNLTIHKMSKRIANSVSWGLEESLDVEWAHSIAPQANITLVEATSASTSALYSAVDWATNNGAHIVSMSWGANDSSGESSLDSHFNHSGVTYLASSGDTGAQVIYPSASPYVLSVGGTSLTLNSNNSYASESAWSSGGGGVSGFEAEPTYQKNYGINQSGRATPDVAFDADPNTGVYVYDSYIFPPGWYEVGGTSLGAPAWAGLIALADQSRSPPLTTSNLTSRTEYNAATGSAYSSNYHDITTGSNGQPAGPGYDLATGVGSPQANNLIPWLISNN
jgi:subtilase family serine protease